MTILITTVAAGALAYLGICAIRWASRRHSRQTTTEVVSPARTTTRPGHLRLPLVRRAHGGAATTSPAPTTPDDPTPTREESGADEDWGTELREMTQELRIHPGFTTDEPEVEIEPADLAHLATIDAAIARFRANCTAVLIRLLPSSVDDTGAIDRAELDAMLEGAQA